MHHIVFNLHPYQFDVHGPSIALFVWLMSHQPAILLSHNKPTTSNQPTVLFFQNKSAPAKPIGRVLIMKL
jgi:hypothetical protein